MGYLILALIVLGFIVTYWPIAVAVGAGAVGVFVYRQWDRQRRDAARQAAMIVLDPRGAKVDVVGESYHQSALLQVSGGRTLDGPAVPDHIALLVPEPDNKHSDTAVMIVIEGHHVGYLGHADGEAYSPIARRAREAGRYVAAHAYLTGGWDRGDGDRGSFGVVLHLGTPGSVEAQVDAALAGRA